MDYYCVEYYDGDYYDFVCVPACNRLMAIESADEYIFGCNYKITGAHKASRTELNEYFGEA